MGDGLEEGVDPNAQWVREAYTVGADGSGLGAFGARFVDFWHYVEETEGFTGVLSELAGEEVGGLSANAAVVLQDPGVDGFLQGSHFFPSLCCFWSKHNSNSSFAFSFFISMKKEGTVVDY